MTAHHFIASKDFNKSTLGKLGKAGIFVTGIQMIPDPEKGWCMAERAYVLDNNGTGMVRTHAEVILMASGKEA